MTKPSQKISQKWKPAEWKLYDSANEIAYSMEHDGKQYDEDCLRWCVRLLGHAISDMLFYDGVRGDQGHNKQKFIQNKIK